MANAPFLCLVWALTDPPPGVNSPGFPIDIPSRPAAGLAANPAAADLPSRASRSRTAAIPVAPHRARQPTKPVSPSQPIYRSRPP